MKQQKKKKFAVEDTKENINEWEEAWGKEREIEGVNLIKVQNMHV
jgi:hypothetical protein